MPFSRKHEIEADQIGLLLMAKACYDPEYAIHFWERMTKFTKSHSVEYISTHPNYSSRIKKLQEFMPNAKNVWVESNCNQVTDGFFKMMRGSF